MIAAMTSAGERRAFPAYGIIPFDEKPFTAFNWLSALAKLTEGTPTAQSSHSVVPPAETPKSHRLIRAAMSCTFS